MPAKFRQINWIILTIAAVLLAALTVAFVVAVRQNWARFAAALVAGGTGLGGAWLGSWTGLRAAEAHGHAEHHAWTRDRRNEAYVEFLDARDNYVESWIAVERLTDRVRSLRGWLEENATHPLGPGDEELEESIEVNRQEFRQAEQQLDTETAKFGSARPSFQKALVKVELFASQPVRGATRAWARDIEERYDWIFRTGEYWGDDVAQTREAELHKHREPFLQLIRDELYICK